MRRIAKYWPGHFIVSQVAETRTFQVMQHLRKFKKKRERPRSQPHQPKGRGEAKDRSSFLFKAIRITILRLLMIAARK